MKISKIKDEAVNITKNILKLGIIATLSIIANSTYKIQSNSTIQHISSDLKQISDGR